MTAEPVNLTVARQARRETSIILCRHGRTDWNELGRYQGQTDVPLNQTGLEQARFLAETLRDEPITAIYSSDLRRAADTAEEIARLHRPRVTRDPRLREINQGRWEGLTVAQIRQRDAELHSRWEADPAIRPTARRRVYPGSPTTSS